MKQTLALVLMALIFSPLPAKADGYPSAFKSSFVNACNKSGDKLAACTCIVTEIEQTIPFSDIRLFEIAKKLGEPTDPVTSKRFVSAIASCAK